MRKSRIGKKYLKWPSRENLLIYDKAKNKCNSFILKSKKEYFQNVSNANSSHSKSLWNAVKPFVSNKGAIQNENIIIKAQKEEQVKVKFLGNEIHINANELIKDEMIKLWQNYLIITI